MKGLLCVDDSRLVPWNIGKIQKIQWINAKVKNKLTDKYWFSAFRL